MRKITRRVINNFLMGIPCNMGNSSVTQDDSFEWVYLNLHGNPIAKRRGDELWITSAGWQTATTKERLNGLPNVHISQRDFYWYLNGQVWDGDWKQV